MLYENDMVTSLHAKFYGYVIACEVVIHINQ